MAASEKSASATTTPVTTASDTTLTSGRGHDGYPIDLIISDGGAARRRQRACRVYPRA
jgi:hypothetical protein